ncbi:hypothetical protein IQ07DRAFT_258845 [Pyrenochaeta sp. DS3sAY3a]|nr:hypothetical protein IQ07DRAFT_258845 [Pyrenochaeta sp. DS3sAY3a]
MIAKYASSTTYFLQRSQALLTLLLSFSSLRLFAGGDLSSVELASGGDSPIPFSTWPSSSGAGSHPAGNFASPGEDKLLFSMVGMFSRTPQSCNGRGVTGRKGSYPEKPIAARAPSRTPG